MSAPDELPKPASTEITAEPTEMLSQVHLPAESPDQGFNDATEVGPIIPAMPAAGAAPLASKPSFAEAARPLAVRVLSGLVLVTQRLTLRQQQALAGCLLVAIGALTALVFSSGARSDDEEFARWARRIAAPEGELVRTALARGDSVSALAALRSAGAKERLRADPAALAVRARLALAAIDPNDALESLEAAITEHPKLLNERWVAESIIQTFNAGRPARTGLLLSKLDKPFAIPLLRTGTADWSWRVRHGAADALKAVGEATPDQVGFLILDAWQTDRCDVQRAAVSKLRAPAMADDRIAPALEALAKRPGLQGCIDDLVPRVAR
jgi:hypothetical protein